MFKINTNALHQILFNIAKLSDKWGSNRCEFRIAGLYKQLFNLQELSKRKDFKNSLPDFKFNK